MKAQKNSLVADAQKKTKAEKFVSKISMEINEILTEAYQELYPDVKDLQLLRNEVTALNRTQYADTLTFLKERREEEKTAKLAEKAKASKEKADKKAQKVSKQIKALEAKLAKLKKG